MSVGFFKTLILVRYEVLENQIVKIALAEIYYFLVIIYTNKISLLDFRTKKILRTIDLKDDKIEYAKLAINKKTVLIGMSSKVINLVNLATGELVKNVFSSKEIIYKNFIVSYDLRVVGWIGKTNQVKFYVNNDYLSLHTSRYLRKLQVNIPFKFDQIKSLDFNYDLSKTFILLQNGELFIMFFDKEMFGLMWESVDLKNFIDVGRYPREIKCTKDGNFLFLLFDDNQIKIVENQNGSTEITFALKCENKISNLFISQNGMYLFLCLEGDIFLKVYTLAQLKCSDINMLDILEKEIVFSHKTNWFNKFENPRIQKIRKDIYS